MFYDLEEPNIFIKDAADSLAEDGIFIAQLMCLKSMIEKNDLGNICHEHIEFYSLKSLKYLFENNGLEIFKIDESEVSNLNIFNTLVDSEFLQGCLTRFVSMRSDFLTEINKHNNE